MSYLAKSTILAAYKILSDIDLEKQQGLTQKVSALKYGAALDLYYKNFRQNCDLKNQSNKDTFSSYVGDIIKINEECCTKDFYTNIGYNGRDFDCGSNFYSQSSVKDSKTNTSKTFLYPKRSGWEPVMDVRNQVLIYRQDYLQKYISYYLNSPKLRLAFILWLLRFERINDDSIEGLRNALNKLFTTEFCNSLFIDSISETDFSYVKFENVICNLSADDFNKLFHPAIRVFTSSNNNKQVSKNMQSDNVLVYLTALRTKPFMLLAGISGTGKSRIVRKLAQASVTEELQRMYDPKSVEKGFKRWELHKPANFELIQVKPNWHNSLEVVGYKSNIGGAHYEFTPFVEFVARAWKHPQVPFFLCLDEMNLAPVEQYFAEFLSAIESRSVENGEYETDPIVKPFNSFNTKNDEGIITDNLSDRMIAHLVGKLDTQRKSEIADRFRTKGLTLPQNLLVMGTVNMDETTFSFSRKVLDRAMSVVMNTVEYDKFFSGESEQDVAEMDDETRRLLIDRPIRGLDAEDNGADEVKDYLTAINGVLQDTPFQLGYRAANEALLYVSAARAFDPAADIKAALDEFTLMKVLSRIEGDKRSIDDLLARLQNVIDKSYPKSHEKLGKMAETLQKKQFVSYWT